MFCEPIKMVDKPRVRGRDYERDPTEKDSMLMPPPSKRTKLVRDPVKNNGVGHALSNTDGEMQGESSTSGTTMDSKVTEPDTLLQPPSSTDEQPFLVSIYDSGFPFGNFCPSLRSLTNFEIYEDPFDRDIYGSQIDSRWYPGIGEDKENMSEGALEDEEADTEMEDVSDTDEAPPPMPPDRLALRERTLEEQLLETQDMEVDTEPIMDMAMNAAVRLAEQHGNNVGMLA